MNIQIEQLKEQILFEVNFIKRNRRLNSHIQGSLVAYSYVLELIKRNE